MGDFEGCLLEFLPLPQSHQASQLFCHERQEGGVVDYPFVEGLEGVFKLFTAVFLGSSGQEEGGFGDVFIFFSPESVDELIGFVDESFLFVEEVGPGCGCSDAAGGAFFFD